jgi:hypothetical protein
MAHRRMKTVSNRFLCTGTTTWAFLRGSACMEPPGNPETNRAALSPAGLVPAGLVSPWSWVSRVPRRRSWMIQEPEAKQPEHQGNFDVGYQTLPEVVPEEQRGAELFDGLFSRDCLTCESPTGTASSTNLLTCRRVRSSGDHAITSDRGSALGGWQAGSTSRRRAAHL